MSYGPPQGYPPPGYGPPQGYPPPGYGPPGYPPPQKKGIGVLGWIGIITLVCFGGCAGIIVLAGVGAKGAIDKSEKKAKAEEAEFDDARAIPVAAEALLSAYVDNEVAADSKYKGKKVRVSGVVDSIGSGFNDEPVVQIKGADTKGITFQHIMAYDVPKAEAAALKKGAAVTVECKADGEIIGSPVLRKCVLK